jgi:phage major head subunit gpT-like protein
MIINQENLQNLYITLNGVFNAAFQESKTWFEQLSMTVPAAGRTVDFKFMLNFPMLQEWVGDRIIQDLEALAYQATVKSYEATIEVDRDDIEDDQLGLYAPVVASLGQEARKHPDRLMALLMAAGFAAACYDGRPFFDATHPVGDLQLSNYAAGAQPAWYLFDLSRAIKPLIYISRRPVSLVRMDRPDDENVFMRKKYRYGVDYRGAVAYGLWQMAYGSKLALTPANYAAARAAMMSLTNADGRPLGITPTLLIVPPSLEAAARTILNADFILSAGSTGGGETNIWKGTANLMVIPELAAS